MHPSTEAQPTSKQSFHCKTSPIAYDISERSLRKLVVQPKDASHRRGLSVQPSSNSTFVPKSKQVPLAPSNSSDCLSANPELGRVAFKPHQPTNHDKFLTASPAPRQVSASKLRDDSGVVTVVNRPHARLTEAMNESNASHETAARVGLEGKHDTKKSDSSMAVKSACLMARAMRKSAALRKPKADTEEDGTPHSVETSRSYRIVNVSDPPENLKSTRSDDPQATLSPSDKAGDAVEASPSRSESKTDAGHISSNLPSEVLKPKPEAPTPPANQFKADKQVIWEEQCVVADKLAVDSMAARNYFPDKSFTKSLKHTDVGTSNQSLQHTLTSTNDTETDKSADPAFSPSSPTKTLNLEAAIEIRDLDAGIQLARGLNPDLDSVRMRCLFLRNSTAESDESGTDIQQIDDINVLRQHCEKQRLKLLSKKRIFAALKKEYMDMCRRVEAAQEDHYKLETLLRKTIAEDTRHIQILETEKDTQERLLAAEQEQSKRLSQQLQALQKKQRTLMRKLEKLQNESERSSEPEDTLNEDYDVYLPSTSFQTRSPVREKSRRSQHRFHPYDTSCHPQSALDDDELYRKKAWMSKAFHQTLLQVSPRLATEIVDQVSAVMDHHILRRGDELPPMRSNLTTPYSLNEAYSVPNSHESPRRHRSSYETGSLRPIGHKMSTKQTHSSKLTDKNGTGGHSTINRHYDMKKLRRDGSEHDFPPDHSHLLGQHDVSADSNKVKVGGSHPVVVRSDASSTDFPTDESLYVESHRSQRTRGRVATMPLRDVSFSRNIHLKQASPSRYNFNSNRPEQLIRSGREESETHSKSLRQKFDTYEGLPDPHHQFSSNPAGDYRHGPGQNGLLMSNKLSSSHVDSALRNSKSKKCVRQSSSIFHTASPYGSQDLNPFNPSGGLGHEERLNANKKQFSSGIDGLKDGYHRYKTTAGSYNVARSASMAVLVKNDVSPSQPYYHHSVDKRRGNLDVDPSVRSSKSKPAKVRETNFYEQFETTSRATHHHHNSNPVVVNNDFGDIKSKFRLQLDPPPLHRKLANPHHQQGSKLKSTPVAPYEWQAA